MVRRIRKRKCEHCREFFLPDYRNLHHQKYCSKPACRKASKVASQRRWSRKPENRDHFRGPLNVERVRAWRETHPGYWRPKSSPEPPALPEDCSRKTVAPQALTCGLARTALQDLCSTQPSVFIGFIAQLTGFALQDDIAKALRTWQLWGEDILNGSPHPKGDSHGDQAPDLSSPHPHHPTPVQLDRSPPGP